MNKALRCVAIRSTNLKVSIIIGIVTLCQMSVTFVGCKVSGMAKREPLASFHLQALGGVMVE